MVKRFIAATKGKGKFQREGDYRLYEGYWSSVLAGGFSTRRVIYWFLSCFPTPLRVLCSHWRSYQRLRLLSLYRLVRRDPDGLQTKAKHLEELYKDFEDWPRRKRFPRGSFSDFLQHIAAQRKKAGPATTELHDLAHQWRAKMHREQAFAMFISLTLTAALAAVVILAIRTAASIFLIWFSSPPIFGGLLEHAQFAEPPWMVIVLACVLVAIYVRVRFYIRYFLADVMFWTTHEEKDSRFVKRTEVVDAAEGMLLHVLRDSRCKRIVVIGHSLGTAIAYNALLRIGRRELAQKHTADDQINWNLDRISHFVTLGSPIDIIHYLFDLHQSRYHRFNRVQERLQGRISDPPFQIDNLPNTNWINIWDDGDPISSRLYSPRHGIPNDANILDVLSRSSVWPNPLAAHLNYLLSETAMRVIFWVTILGRMPSTLPEMPAWGHWISKVRVGTKIAAALTVWLALFAVLGLLTPWLPLGLMGLFLLAGFAASYADDKIDLIFDKALKS